MPVQQQYLIAFAIVGLVAVLAAFAIFDFVHDESRYANQMAMWEEAGPAFSGGVPYAAAAGANAATGYLCYQCGRRGAALGWQRCPNCRAVLGQGGGAGAQAGAGVNIPGGTQNVAFSSPPPRTTNRSAPRYRLWCASCNFAMDSRRLVSPNSIRCPRCPMYLISTAQAPSSGGRYGSSGGRRAYSPGAISYAP